MISILFNTVGLHYLILTFFLFLLYYVRYRDRVLPFVMCLTTSKEVGVYRQILQHVKAKVLEVTGHRWRPQRVVLDFEAFMLSALETELPRIERSPCYFHFTQSLWRRVQRLGLVVQYRRNDALRKCIRKIMSIGYVFMSSLSLKKKNYRSIFVLILRKCE